MTALDAPAAVGPRYRLDAPGWRSIALMGGVVVALFAIGFLLLAAAVPGHYNIEGAEGPGVFGWATGLLAMTLGMRHAFDVDHIAAIDNTTRKLAADGKRPLAVGFFFSLGHSTIVFLMAVVLGFGIAAFNTQVQDDGSLLHQVTGVIGPSVSGVFLMVIAVINILVTVAIVRVFRRMRAGEFDESQFEEQLRKRGVLNRLFGRIADRIDASWKIYPLGVLFGLGFDTATEITLLVLSGSAVLGGLPWWAVLSLPFLFAAGMCLFDTLDGVLMNFAYGWAFLTPTRKVYYNVVITAMSAFIAVVIGMVQLCSVLADNLGWNSPFLEWFDSLGFLGYAIVGTLIATWLIALLVWRLGRFEERVKLTT
ncbi:high-affinity nickel-transport protein [Leifsonia sp. AK011]|uniref:HoxN/HupN/NixA family nickel/cobalt transporter n=1 Tax=Leifsonia sp. AK011 TaxID=2723075 RepID=UPI00182C5B4D|nr:HoxN/HupN/NixA family nickel/cobalt transporter [Leifsonia sp. AK011]NYF09026.1 high-affinity nickel-transport protein [Leifsonia sp. AK011]